MSLESLVEAGEWLLFWHWQGAGFTITLSKHRRVVPLLCDLFLALSDGGTRCPAAVVERSARCSLITGVHWGSLHPFPSLYWIMSFTHSGFPTTATQASYHPGWSTNLCMSVQLLPLGFDTPSEAQLGQDTLHLLPVTPQIWFKSLVLALQAQANPQTNPHLVQVQTIHPTQRLSMTVKQPPSGTSIPLTPRVYGPAFFVQFLILFFFFFPLTEHDGITMYWYHTRQWRG